MDLESCWDANGANLKRIQTCASTRQRAGHSLLNVVDRLLAPCEGSCFVALFIKNTKPVPLNGPRTPLGWIRFQFASFASQNPDLRLPRRSMANAFSSAPSVSRRAGSRASRASDTDLASHAARRSSSCARTQRGHGSPAAADALVTGDGA